MTIQNFESVLTHVGGFGCYQGLLFGVAAILNIFVAFVYFGQMFMTLTPPHWCHAPPGLEDLNLTEAQLKELTIPRHENGEFQSCARYDVNFTQVVESRNLSWPDPSWPLTSCTHGWTYNFSLYYPTITSQLNWVCEEDWRPALAQSLFFVGSMVGSPSLGWAADIWGRLPIIIFTNLLGGVAGVASAFSSSFAMFAACRFFVGITHEQQGLVAFVLFLEYVGSEYRTLMANLPVMIFLTLGMCALPWIALALADWMTFAIVIHAVQFLSIIFIWVIPESARWLLSQGRVDDTLTILQKVAKINGKAVTPRMVQEFKAYGEKQAKSHSTSQGVTTFDLFKTPVLRRRFLVLCIMWITMTVAYDGFMRNTANIGYDVFFSFTIAGLLEFPADLLMMVTTEWLGRRHTTVWSLVLCGLSALSIAAIPEANTLAVMVMAFVGRFLITVTMNVGHQYPVEVLPTVARGQGMGTMQTLGFASAFASPYIVYSSKYSHSLPYIIMGAITVAGGLVCLLLPETLNENLPDTLEDGETFFSGQRLCYNPCAARPKKEKAALEDEERKGVDNPAFETTRL
ncbi:organic cation transporter protein-like [Penaeus japonicus]|uniref:organic cation transporter protein-like n=1 Tax=Penaeus japonicus TaxID=27405 RepID=UPI001C717ACD|nr:organic cation transporter protein-like [Penaeus japonicus]XP_042872135.1 organic cation transporter protein-like [Penaeus japonicus]